MDNSKKLEMLCAIIESFEDLLDKYGIEIPNPEKSEEESAANIYGSDYGDLEEEIENILKFYNLL